RASRVGFDWPHNEEGLDRIVEKIEEEVRELREALAEPAAAPPGPAEDGGRNRQRIEAEFGDILFAMVNLARVVKVNPEEALRKAANRFAERFGYIEAQAARSGRPMDALTLVEMDALWEEAKQKEASSPAGLEGTS
ncbi:MAG: hypothetical protein FJ246_09785, partial [Nitrospira sp.]|nr:hypothetical protein [Nitrospira sp.]